MIVIYKENGWQIITQKAHGLLAAQLCYNWQNKQRPKRWLETIVAIAEHDDASNELNGKHLVGENGGPLNFSMAKFEENYCDNLINMALTKSKYMACLTNMHVCFLYKTEEKATEYCKKLKKTIKIWLKELQISYDEINKAYHILEWCDAFSLLICQQLIQTENRKSEISFGPDNVVYQFYEKQDHCLIVQPWPYNIESFEVTYESKTLESLTFKNNQDFLSKYLKAPTEFHKYVIKKS